MIFQGSVVNESLVTRNDESLRVNGRIAQTKKQIIGNIFQICTGFDLSFTFSTKTPPASVLLKKAAGIQSGSGRPNTQKVGKVSREQLEGVANIKMPDLTAADLDAAVRTIAGTARSMGLDVEGV